MSILNTVQSVLSVLLIISLGHFLTAKKIFDKNTSILFSKIVVNLSLPCLIISNLSSRFEKGDLSQMGPGLLIGFGVVLSGYFIAYMVSIIFKTEPSRRGLFRAIFTFSNTVYIGMPVNIVIFGQESVPYVLLYYLAHSTTFFTLGFYGIQSDHKKAKAKITLVNSVKKLINPILLSFLISIGLILLDINLPFFIMNTFEYLGNLTTPLAMLFIGITLYFLELKSFNFSKDIALSLMGKFIVLPILVILFFKFFPGTALMQKVFVIEAAMPVMATMAIVCQPYKSDHNFATVMIALSTVISLLVIPLYVFLLNMMNL